MIPQEGSGSRGADDADYQFEAATWAIEACYEDLLGIEAVSQAVRSSYGAQGRGADPEVGIGGDGPAGVLPYTMPTRTPYQVSVHLTEQHPGEVASQLDAIFRQASGYASGTAERLQSLIDNVFGVDVHAVWSAADAQYQTCTHLAGQFIDNFADVGQLMNDHFKGETARRYREWYDKVDDVVNQLIDFAGVAQIGAAATANVLWVAKASMVTIGREAQTAFETTLDAWKQDAGNFPFQPGLTHQSITQFKGLVDQVVGYAKKIPGVIGKAAGAAEKAEGIVGTIDRLIQRDEKNEQAVTTIASRSAELLASLTDALVTKSADVSAALDRIGSETRPHRQEIESRPQLVLPVERPEFHYA